MDKKSPVIDPSSIFTFLRGSSTSRKEGRSFIVPRRLSGKFISELAWICKQRKKRVGETVPKKYGEIRCLFRLNGPVISYARYYLLCAKKFPANLLLFFWRAQRNRGGNELSGPASAKCPDIYTTTNGGDAFFFLRHVCVEYSNNE